MSGLSKAKMLKLRRNLGLFKNVSVNRCLASQSVQPATQERADHEDRQLKEFERISNIQRKIRTKKPQRPPFVKNLFLGIFDFDLLTYPELSNEDLNNLNKTLEQVRSLFEQPSIKDHNTISKEFLRKLAIGRLLGLQSSQLINGRELTTTETCKVFEEISEHNLKNALINNEALGAQTLIRFASDHLNRNYLQSLVNGDRLSAFLVLDPLPSRSNIFKVTASRSGDGKTWVLNGLKNFVINGSDADFYIVIANSDYVIKDELRERKYSVFVVERDSGGITSTKKSTNGGFELSDVVFDNTHIPDENLIGNEGDGEKILAAIYPEYRLSVGPVCSVLLRKLINNMTQHYINFSEGPNFLYETDAVRTKMGEFLSSLYALDSMIYLTSGLIDNYENQDVELESTIVKVFASEQAFLASSACLDMVGPEASLPTHWCNQLHQEALCHVTLHDTNDNLKVLIALFGLRHAGQEINEIVRKLRNPLFNAATVLKRIWSDRKQADDNPNLNLFLHHYLHPSCLHGAQRLEYCVLRLKYATEILLSRYGAEVINKHADLRLLAEVVIDIYAMAACLGRASRSYCIGLQHAEYEMTLASAYSVNATKRVKAKLGAIIDGPFMTTDENFRFVSERLFSFKQYYPVHPLTRNF